MTNLDNCPLWQSVHELQYELSKNASSFENLVKNICYLQNTALKVTRLHYVQNGEESSSIKLNEFLPNYNFLNKEPPLQKKTDPIDFLFLSADLELAFGNLKKKVDERHLDIDILKDYKHEDFAVPLLNLSFSILRLGRFSTEFLISLLSYDYDYLLCMFCKDNKAAFIVSTDFIQYLSFCRADKNPLTNIDVFYDISTEPLLVAGRKIIVSSTSKEKLLRDILKVKKLSQRFSRITQNCQQYQRFCLNYTYPTINMAEIMQQLHGISKKDTCTNTAHDDNPSFHHKTAQSVQQQFFKVIQLTQREVTFLIGKKGAKIERIRNESNCNIKILPSTVNLDIGQSVKNSQALQFIRVVSNDKGSFEACMRMIERELLIYRFNIF